MSEEIKIRVGEVEYKGDKEFAKNELLDLVASLVEASGEVSLPGNDQAASTVEADAGMESSPQAPENDKQKQAASDSRAIPFDDLAMLLHEANWNSEREKALLAAAFLQENGEADATTGPEINKALKPLRKQVANISIATGGLEKRGLLLHNGMDGNSKKYKVTGDGLDEVKRLLEEEGE